MAAVVTTELLDTALPEAEDDKLLDTVVPESSTPPYTQEGASATADQFDYAMAGNSPGRDAISQALLTGQEGSLRQNLSIITKMQERAKREQALQDHLSSVPSITDDDVTFARSLAENPDTPPLFVVEKAQAKRMLEEVQTAGEDSWQEDMDAANPVELAAVKGISENMITRNLLGQKYVQEINKRYEELPAIRKFGEFAETFVPFLSSYRMTNAIEGTDANALFLGENLKNQRDNLWLSSRTPEEFDANLRAATEAMWESNPQLAQEFVNYMVTWPAGADGVYNFMNLADATGGFDLYSAGAAVGIGVLARKGAFRVIKASADLMKSQVAGFNRTAIADAAGDAAAAHALAWKRFGQKVELSGVRPQSFDEIGDFLDPMVNPENVVGGSYSYLMRERSRRLLVEMQERSANLINRAHLDPVRIDRMTDNAALKEAMTDAELSWNLQLPYLSNRVLQVRHATLAQDTLQNVHIAEMVIGDAEANLFRSFEDADLEAKMLGLIGHTVQPQGGKFYISLKKAIPEVGEGTRDKLATETAAQPPVNATNMYLSYLRSREGLIDPQSLRDYKIAQAGSSTLFDLMKKEAEAIGGLPVLRKDSRRRLSAFLQAERVQPTGKPGEVGMTSRTLGEFEQKWFDHHNVLPTDDETSAYWSFVQINNNDLLLRNFGILRDKGRAGIENFSIRYTVAPATDMGNQKSGFRRMHEGVDIEGKTVQTIPWENRDIEDAGIYVLGRDVDDQFTITTPQRTTTGNYFRLKTTSRTEFDKQFGTGQYRIIQLTNLGEEQLRELPGLGSKLPQGRIQFLVVKDAKVAPLKFWQIPARSGFHVAYPMSGSRVVQPRVRTHGNFDPHSTYYGDNTFLWQAMHVDAERLAKIADDARPLVKEVLSGTKTKKDLGAYLKGKLPGHDANRFLRLFRGPSKIFDVDQPFLAVRMGERSFDAHKLVDKYPKLRASTDSVYNLYKGFDLEYTMKRDMPLNTVKNVGTTTSPVYKLESATMLDPIPTLERAMSDTVRGRYLDDLKIKEAEKFVQLFHSVLDTPLKDLRRDPIHAIMNPTWKKVGTNDERQLLASAKNFRQALVDFMAVKDDAGKNLSWLQWKISQSIYKGEQPSRAFDRWAISKIQSPTSFFRAAAFHSKMGLFTPVQLFKQLNTLVHVSALSSPQAAANGLFAGLLMRPMLQSPTRGNIKHAAKMAAKWGWKPREFEEAFDALRRSDFWHVGREVSQLDDYLGATSFDGPFGKMLHWGTAPFRLGDQLPRLTAFNVAYRKWRLANPSKRLTDNIIGQLVDEADKMTVNMTAVSNAQIQRGVGGIFTQFMGYQARMAEQILGKKLTGAEKRRVLLTYAALYGVPVAGAAAIGAWPIGETAREIELAVPSVGEATDSNFVMRTLAHGSLGAIIHQLTGQDWNISESYGPAGLQLLEDIIDGDKDTLEVLGGASTSVFHDAFMAFEPLTMMIVDSIRGDGEFMAPSADDVVDFLKVISSVNQADKLYHALAWGEYVTKSGIKIDDVTGWEGVFMSLFGLTPQRIVDAFIKLDNNKDYRAFQDRMKQEALKHYRRGYRLHDLASRNKDNPQYFEDAVKEFEKAGMFLTSGRFKPIERGNIVVESMAGHKNLLLDVGKRYAEQSPEKLQAWLKELRKRDQ